MNLDEARARLAGAGLPIDSESRLGNDSGWQLRLGNGAIVNVFDSGKLTYQGKNADQARTAVEGGLQSKPTAAANPNHVFVVYGHDPEARNQLEVMLRRWKLEPLILDQLPSEGATIIEKLEKYTANVGFAVVLATPDDEGHRTGHPDEKTHRARQNVVLELGMLLARLGRSRVAILLKDPGRMERPSDIQGLIYISFKENLQVEAGPTLAKEMAAVGYKIDVRNL